MLAWKEPSPPLKVISAWGIVLGVEARGGVGTRKPTVAPHPFLSLAFPYSFSKMSFIALAGYTAGGKKPERVTIEFFCPKHFQYQ